MNNMVFSSFAQSGEIQAKKVFKFMLEMGSVNRYEAERFGVCELPARVQELEKKGFKYTSIDEDGVADFHGIKHNRIRRYFIDWDGMTLEATAFLLRWINE